MEITKSQKRDFKNKIAVFGILFLLYNIGLTRNLIWLRDFSSLIFFVLTGILIWNNIRNVKHEDDKMHFYLVALILNWVIRNIKMLVVEGTPFICLLGPSSFITLSISFFIVACIFVHCAKKLNKSQLILDAAIIQSVLVAIGIAVNYFSGWSEELPTWQNVAQYVYHFFELMTVVMILVVFTSFRQRRLSKHNILTLSAILSYILIRGFYQYGMTTNEIGYLWFAESIYLVPAGMLLIASEMINAGNSNIFFEVSYDENRLVDSLSKSYLVLFLGCLSIVLYMKEWISNVMMIFIFLMLAIYYVMNTAFQNTFRAEKRLRDEERKRKQLEYEVDRRTRELQQRNEELKEKNELLGDLIYFDMNLGLYTIRYLQEYLVAWNQDHPLTLMVIDIKGFKNINSLFSYAVGDEVLVQIASRLKTEYSNNAVLFRLNSNKFGLLFLRSVEEERILQIINEIHAMGEDPIEIDEFKIRLKFSIGIASYEQNSADIQKILESAEYAEREAHRMIQENAYQIFDREIERKIEREKRIRRLLEYIDFDQEFELYYQPQCDVERNLLGMEALLRWNSPELGQVSPGEFIPIAEQSSVILRIAQWTLRKGIEQIKIWNNTYQQNYRIGINISTKFIENSSFLKYVQDIIAEFQIPPEWLDLEVTETSLINFNKEIIQLFEKLAELGVSISIDDFGTGYSSLSYINSFRISNIKIARELVMTLENNPKESALVKAIIMMANSLELDIIAEGVEEEAQLQILDSLGCRKIQGYYFGKPQTAADFEYNFIAGDHSFVRQ